MMREIASIDELAALAGQEVALSDWVEMSQARVNLFADATSDHQWIHVDEERARRESPFGGSVAHGFLTLSLLPAMLETAMRVDGVRLVVNYGLNKVRFPAPVPVGSRVRARFTLGAAEPIDQGVQFTWDVLIEVASAPKPACAAELLIRLYR